MLMMMVAAMILSLVRWWVEHYSRAQWERRMKMQMQAQMSLEPKQWTEGLALMPAIAACLRRGLTLVSGFS